MFSEPKVQVENSRFDTESKQSSDEENLADSIDED
jgi:hypothetical protein